MRITPESGTTTQALPEKEKTPVFNGLQTDRSRFFSNNTNNNRVRIIGYIERGVFTPNSTTPEKTCPAIYNAFPSQISNLWNLIALLHKIERLLSNLSDSIKTPDKIERTLVYWAPEQQYTWPELGHPALSANDNSDDRSGSAPPSPR